MAGRKTLERGRKSKMLGKTCLGNREKKPIMPGKQADLQAIQLCGVKDYVSGRKSWKEKSIKICFYYYILFIYFIILYYNEILKYLIKICKYTWPV